MSDIIVWEVAAELTQDLFESAFNYLQNMPVEEAQYLSGQPENLVLDFSKLENVHEITPVFGKYSTRNKGFSQELNRIQDMVKDYVSRKKFKDH